MLERLTSFVSVAGPAGLRQPEQRFSGAACLVVASMLMDSEFGQFIVTGVHRASGWTETGPVSRRFSSHVLSTHRRITGHVNTEQRRGWSWAQHIGIPPWTAASQLSMTSGRTEWPVQYLWYPASPGSGHDLERVARSLHHDQPALVYMGSLWRPRHVVLVVNADHESFSYYDPATGNVQTDARSRFLTYEGKPGATVVHRDPDRTPRQLVTTRPPRRRRTWKRNGTHVRSAANPDVGNHVHAAEGSALVAWRCSRLRTLVAINPRDLDTRSRVP
jgi:hypothetical protein